MVYSLSIPYSKIFLVIYLTGYTIWYIMRCMGRTLVNAFKCDRCNHTWLPKAWDGNPESLDELLPKVCPHCKSPYWNTPRKNVGNNSAKS